MKQISFIMSLALAPSALRSLLPEQEFDGPD